MKLLFKQRLFSWFDSYDVFDENGEAVYTVQGQVGWGHCLKIYDSSENELGMVKERVFSLLPKFEIYTTDEYLGCIGKEFSFFKPKFNIDYNDWRVEGDIFEWNYSVYDEYGMKIATVTKEVLNWTDTYILDITRKEDSLFVLMLAIAIDAEKCSRN